MGPVALAAVATPSRGARSEGTTSADAVVGHRRPRGESGDSTGVGGGKLADVGQASSSRSPRQPRPHSAPRVQGRNEARSASPAVQPSWHQAEEPDFGRPMTARGRCGGGGASASAYNGHTPSRGGRPLSARGAGAGSWHPRGHDGPDDGYAPAGPSGTSRRGRPPAELGYSSRGRDTPHGGPNRDTMQVTCRSERNPRRIVQEVLQALSAHGLSYRQVSNFTVRCQDGGVRIQLDVLQVDRGGRYMLRMSRVSGEVWHFKDLCSRLINDMAL